MRKAHAALRGERGRGMAGMAILIRIEEQPYSSDTPSSPSIRDLSTNFYNAVVDRGGSGLGQCAATRGPAEGSSEGVARAGRVCLQDQEKSRYATSPRMMTMVARISV